MVSTTLATSGGVLYRAGAKVSPSLSAGTLLVGTDFILDKWINQAESHINTLTKYNWVSNYSTLDANNKLILEEATECLSAIPCINYDLSKYTSRTEAEIMIDVLRDTALQKLELLKEIAQQEFIKGS